MGRDQHRAIVKAGQGFYQIADFVDTRRVKTVCGFVQNQNRRTPQERPGKAQALLHSQRILFCQPVAKLGQPYQFQSIFHISFRQSQNAADNVKIFPPCEIRVERRRFDERTDLFENGNPILRKLFPINGKAAFCGVGQPQQHFHGSGFASPVRAKKTINAALANMKRNMIDRSEVLIFLGQLFRCNDIVHRNISFRCFYGTTST